MIITKLLLLSQYLCRETLWIKSRICCIAKDNTCELYLAGSLMDMVELGVPLPLHYACNGFSLKQVDNSW